MNAISPEFLVFFLLVFGLHSTAAPIFPGLGRWVLIVASLIFYGWHTPVYLPLLLGVAGFVYLAGRALAFNSLIRSKEAGTLPRTRGSGRLLFFFLAVLIAFLPLVFFKYSSFLASLCCPGAGFDPDLALPLGISFYTFQAISFLTDIYRRPGGIFAPSFGSSSGSSAPAFPSMTEFLLYISFFPQLVAGPIVRSDEFFPQLQRRGVGTGPDYRRGALYLATGYVKKAVLADGLAVQLVDPVFGSPEAYGPAYVVAGLIAFSLQIYLDFSGYSDIAIGLAALFGIRLPENFHFPYTAPGLREFWRRWHITLSAWLRDHLYIPLGGSRHGAGRMAMALFVTMLLGGLWHGAHVNFLLWGAGHGLLLGLERLIPLSFAQTRFMAAVSRVYTFVVVTLLWIPFRTGMDAVASKGEATTTMREFLQAMLPVIGEEALAGVGRGILPDTSILFLVITFLGVLASPGYYGLLVHFYTKRNPILLGVISALVLMAVVFLSPGQREFVYFVF